MSKSKPIACNLPAPENNGLLYRFVGFRDRLRVAWHNWRVRGTRKAYRALTQAMQDDSDYAHSWMCNIAIKIYDGAKCKLSIHEANAIAEDLMAHLFDVKMPNVKANGRHFFQRNIRRG